MKDGNKLNVKPARGYVYTYIIDARTQCVATRPRPETTEIRKRFRPYHIVMSITYMYMYRGGTDHNEKRLLFESQTQRNIMVVLLFFCLP